MMIHLILNLNLTNLKKKSLSLSLKRTNLKKN